MSFLHEAIVNPAAMQTELTDACKFNSLLRHLSAGDWTDDFVEFEKGALYGDGRIDLCKQGCQEAVPSIVTALEKNGRLKHFLFGNNLSGYNGAKAMAQLLKDHRQTLETLYIAGNDFDAYCMLRISDAIRFGENVLSQLWLKHNPLGPAGAASLGTFLPSNRNLAILDLTNCGIFDTGCAALLCNMTANVSLTVLYLSENGITAASIPALTSYFSNCKKPLKKIWLDGNNLACGSQSADDFSALGRSMKDKVQLVSLKSCGLNHTTAGAFCQQIASSATLECISLGRAKTQGHLKLSKNDFSANAYFLVELAYKTPTLKFVDFSSTNCPASLGNICVSLLPKLLHVSAELDPLAKETLKKRVEADTGLPYAEFMNGTGPKSLRALKCFPEIIHIDSVYRNRLNAEKKSGLTCEWRPNVPIPPPEKID